MESVLDRMLAQKPGWPLGYTGTVSRRTSEARSLDHIASLLAGCVPARSPREVGLSRLASAIRHQSRR